MYSMQLISIRNLDENNNKVYIEIFNLIDTMLCNSDIVYVFLNLFQHVITYFVYFIIGDWFAFTLQLNFVLQAFSVRLHITKCIN